MKIYENYNIIFDDIVLVNCMLYNAFQELREEERMKLSISTDSLSAYRALGLSDLEVLEAVSKTDFKIIDYCMTNKNHAEPIIEGAAFKESLDRTGLYAYQAHAILGYNPLLMNEKREWAFMKNALVFCEKAGIKQIVIHPGATEGNSREEFMENNAAFYRSLIPYCEETGVGVMIENIGNYADPYLLRNGEDLKELLLRVDHPMITACWDTGHANHFFPDDCDQYSSICALGNKLTAIHFHDNAGYFSDERKHYRIDMHMPPYMSWCGSLNYDAVLQALCDIGYQGTFNFEVTAFHFRRDVEPFHLNGNVVDKLRLPPLRLWIAMYNMIYEIGKYMLETYGVYEA